MIDKWTKEFIQDKITNDSDWTERAIVAIYCKQTADERMLHITRDFNGVGFNGADSALLSSFAEQILKGRKLSVKQLFYAQKKSKNMRGNY